MKPKDYNKIKWGDYFIIDETSKSGIKWIAPKYFRGKPKYDRIGTDVGSIVPSNRGKYWVVGLSFGTYLIHRIMWVMLYGEIDNEYDVDHIDGNGLNNTVGNLRCVTKSVNSRNKVLRTDNKSGVTGVQYEKTTKTEGYRACVIDEQGIKHRKFFSINKYENAKELAVQWKELKLKELNYAGYTERHGK